MQDWDGKLASAASVGEVMAILGDFLRYQRAEHQNALLPAHCRHIVLTTPADVEWWLRELNAAPLAYGTGRMILQLTRGTFAAAWRRLDQLGYCAAMREASPAR
jgi:hypothetical protein